MNFFCILIGENKLTYTQNLVFIGVLLILLFSVLLWNFQTNGQ